MTTIVCFIMCLIYLCVAENPETLNVNTPVGQITGLKQIYPETGESLFEFRGIPYGKPPVGSLRFRKPEPFGTWKGSLDGTKFGSPCPQIGIEFLPGFVGQKDSEDCLVLNVYVPRSFERETKLSVMVWIHGGGFIIGHAHQYDGGRIAMEGDVIVVTINYRLGIFGFLAVDHPASRGNYGLWDQKLALQWVHDNIAAFGGNPGSVTIFGESAGGFSVSFQSLIPSNKGLFQRVIAQSGVVTRTIFPKRRSVKKLISKLSEKTSCVLDDLHSFVNCLRGKTVEELLNATNQFLSMPSDRLGFEGIGTPVLDGELFQDHPIRKLEDESSDVTQFFRSLDFMTGTTSGEGSLLYIVLLLPFQQFYGFNITEGIPSKVACEGIASPFVESFYDNDETVKEKICSKYCTETSLEDQSMKATELWADIIFNYGTMQMLKYHTSSHSKTYQYIFSKISSKPAGGPVPKWFKGSGHGDELIYFFDVKGVLVLGEEFVLSEDDKTYAKKLIKYWTSFAKSGYPDGGEWSVAWKPFNMEDKTYIEFDVDIKHGRNLNPEMEDFWSNQLPKIELDVVDKGTHDEL